MDVGYTSHGWDRDSVTCHYHHRSPSASVSRAESNQHAENVLMPVQFDSTGNRIASPDAMENDSSSGSEETYCEVDTDLVSQNRDINAPPFAQTGRNGIEDLSQTQLWNETRTKAGKERKRLPLACIMCRRKKIRCSGEKPSCKHCIRSRMPCVYKQTARKSAPKVDYMSMLDRRLKRMEERLLKYLPKDEIASILAQTGRSVVRPSTTSSKKRTACDLLDRERNSFRNQNVRRKSSHEVGCVDSPLTAQPTAQHSDLIGDGSHTLPPRDIQEHLVQVFFECVYGQPYLLLHKPSFMRKLRNGTAPAILVLAICAVSSRFSRHPAVQNRPPFLAGETFAAEALSQLLKNFDSPSITNLTVALILGLHDLGTCHGGRSWALAGIAIRMAHALHLHKESDSDLIERSRGGSKLDQSHDRKLLEGYSAFVVREIRRRCMWACFVMDQLQSAGTGRPCAISEGNLNIQLPVDDQSLVLEKPVVTEQLNGGLQSRLNASGEGGIQNVPVCMGISAYMVRAVALYGRVARFICHEKIQGQQWGIDPRCAVFCAQVDQFAEGLPLKLQFSDESVKVHYADHRLSKLVALHVLIQQTRLLLHRSLVVTTSSPGDNCGLVPQETLKHALEATIDSATRIGETLRCAKQRGIRLTVPFIGYCAFNACLVHLVQLFHDNRDTRVEAREHLESCLYTLIQMRQYWGPFGAIAESLKGIYREFSGKSASSQTDIQHHEAGHTLPYGEWLTKYPRGIPSRDIEALSTQPMKSGDSALTHRADLQTVDSFFDGFNVSLESLHYSGGEGDSTSIPTLQNQHLVNRKLSPSPDTLLSDSQQPVSVKSGSGQPALRAESVSEQLPSPQPMLLRPTHHEKQAESQVHSFQPAYDTISSLGPSAITNLADACDVLSEDVPAAVSLLTTQHEPSLVDPFIYHSFPSGMTASAVNASENASWCFDRRASDGQTYGDCQPSWYVI